MTPACAFVNGQVDAATAGIRLAAWPLADDKLLTAVDECKRPSPMPLWAAGIVDHGP